MAPRKTLRVTAQHPGEIIAERLARRGRTQQWLGDQVGVSDGFISRLLRGQNNLTADLAIRIEEVLRISAQRLMWLQAEYNLAEARERLKTKTVTPSPSRARQREKGAGAD